MANGKEPAARPVSALSASLGAAGASAQSDNPLHTLDERQVDVENGGSLEATPSRQFARLAGDSPPGGDYARAGPRGSSGAGAHVGSLGASFKSGHSFMLNAIERPRRIAMPQPSPGSGACLVLGWWC
jgi:hypothetical protein